MGHTVKAIAGLGHSAVSSEVDGWVCALDHVDGVGRGGRREGGDETRQLGQHSGWVVFWSWPGFRGGRLEDALIVLREPKIRGTSR